MQEDATKETKQGDTGNSAVCNRRILLIDDNHAIHDDYNKILMPPRDTGELDELGSMLFDSATPAPQTKTIGFETASAYQGQEALALVERSIEEGRPFAMAFVDMRMPPGWDGLETIQRLWAVAPDLQIVICSAYSDHSWDELVDELPKEDQWLLLRKPFDGAEVSQMALALTKKWNLESDSRKAMRDLQSALQEREALLDALTSSTNRMYAECGDITGRVEKSFGAMEVLLQACTDLEQAATAEGIPAQAWGEVLKRINAAGAQSEMNETLNAAQKTLDTFRKIRQTVVTMRGGETIGN